MTSDILKSITDYVDYLRTVHKLQVSICNIAHYFDMYMHLILPYNYHINTFCNCIKSNDECRNICVYKQNKVVEKCKDGVFFGCCWAGMEEYVFPIKNGDTVLGFISVSGYTKNREMQLSKIKSVCKTYDFDEKSLLKKFDESTTDNIPELSYLKVIINPLCIMLEKLYSDYTSTHLSKTDDDTLYERTLDYICLNFCKNLSLDLISKSLHYSKSYIRQLFKKNSGCSIMEYIDGLKIKKAKELLSNSLMPISKISIEIGYEDTNYFSTKFKNVTGITPKKYRDANLKKL